MQRENSAGLVRYGAAVVLTIMALALWGLGHRLYAALLPDLAAALHLSPQRADMARAAVAIGYFVMALPTAFISRNFGCKVGVLFGLGTFAFGMFLFHPAVEQHSFLFLILAAAVIGSGLAIIQITTAPLILFLGPKDSAIQRMNFAQAFTPLGSLCGLFLSQRILGDVLSKNSGDIGHNLMLPLSTVGVVAIALAFALELANFPAGAIARSPAKESTWASFLPPLRHARFRFGLFALLFSLLAQVIIAGFAVRFCQTVMPSWTPAVTFQWYVVGILAFTVGRFTGSVLMFWLEPMALLVVFCVASALCSAVAIVAPGIYGIYAMILASFFLSIQLPTIFAHALRDLGESAKSAAAIMMLVAFSGTGLIGLVALLTTTQTLHAIMLLPAVCFAAAAVFAAAMRRAERAEKSWRPAASKTAEGGGAIEAA